MVSSRLFFASVASGAQACKNGLFRTMKRVVAGTQMW
jgi:hypothetical protein